MSIFLPVVNPSLFPVLRASITLHTSTNTYAFATVQQGNTKMKYLTLQYTHITSEVSDKLLTELWKAFLHGTWNVSTLFALFVLQFS